MSDRRRPATNRVADLLDLADRTVGACLARVPTTSTITREQWRTLMLLDERAEPDAGPRPRAQPAAEPPEGAMGPGHTMGEIAARAAVPAATATRLVDRLVADGLAFRRSDPWDRRRVLVHISPTGHELVTRAAHELDRAFGTVFGDLDAADRLDLVGLLGRLGAAVRTEEGTRGSGP